MANANTTCKHFLHGDITQPPCGAPATHSIGGRAPSLCGRHAAARVHFMGAAANVLRAEAA